MRKLTFILAILACVVLHASVIVNAAETVTKIEVTGNERIDAGVVLNAVKTKENTPYDLDKIREDMKNIYKTGFFSDVQVDVRDGDKGKIVTFVVVERPPIKSIFLSGNKKLKTENLITKLKIRPNTVLNTDKIKESIDELNKYYASEGYYGTKIDYTIEYGDEYEVKVTINIDESTKVYVKNITFTGNKAFKAGTLKDAMRTREKGLLSWFTGSGILDEDALEEDRKNLEAFYSDKGYVKISVGVPVITLSKDAKSISINIPLEEGSPYKIGSMDFKGDVIFPKEDLLKQMKTRTGSTFSSGNFHEDVLKLTDMYQDRGYAFAEIVPLTNIKDEDKTVDVTYNITRGQEVYFNRVNILGNTKTRDKVVRRELKFGEGDRFSASDMKESKRKLKNTTFFKDIDMKIIRTEDPNKVNVDLTVEERPTGSINFGVGYSSAERVMVSGSVAQENFLGTGRKLMFDASLSTYTHQYKFTFIEPYVFDKNFSAGISAFNYEREMDTYDYKKTGGRVTLTRPLTDYVKLSSAYRLENVNVRKITSDASAYVRAQRGSNLTSAVSFTLNKNTIDDIMNPTSGLNTEITAEVAGGPFGGDNNFYSFVGTYGRYFPVKFLESAFFVKGTAGMIRSFAGKEVPIYEKFYVGGLDSIRGFRYGEAGPLDENGEAIGSKNQLFFNFEYIFPIFKPAGLKGVLFFDAGHGFDRWSDFSLKTTAGGGVRWFSPFGPIRLEFGINLNPKKDERKNAFEFAIGTQY
ncbi:MAG TPA: outer membrane protein assembly factor BamA [Syntrophorhabdaceae bacterium]|nr:outer membrane protein assembly factor BamA [Syntrophorhabdaceae bacterium]